MYWTLGVVPLRKLIFQGPIYDTCEAEIRK